MNIIMHILCLSDNNYKPYWVELCFFFSEVSAFGEHITKLGLHRGLKTGNLNQLKMVNRSGGWWVGGWFLATPLETNGVLTWEDARGKRRNFYELQTTNLVFLGYVRFFNEFAGCWVKSMTPEYAVYVTKNGMVAIWMEGQFGPPFSTLLWVLWGGRGGFYYESSAFGTD